MKPVIYFFIPVWNEQDTIGLLLYRIGEVMRNLRFDYEVLIVLDACTDESAEVIAPYLKLVPVHVIQYEQRQGYARSLLAAIRRAVESSENPKRDFFLILDGDFRYDPELVGEMASQIERNVDLCIGNRFLGEQAQPTRRQRLRQWLVGRVLRLRRVNLPAGPEPDWLTTFRGARVSFLKRNQAFLEVLSGLGPEVPPAACSLTLFLRLFKDARNLEQLPLAEKRHGRRKSRPKLWNILRFLLFRDEFIVTGQEVKQVTSSRRGRSGRGRRRKSSNRPGESSSNSQGKS